MNGKPPCKGCTEREPGCHDRCARYKAWRAEWDNYKEKHRTTFDANRAAFDGRKRLGRLKSQTSKSAIRGEKR